ncbi:glycosylase [Protaetiibacter larvae]|uniref:Glycosylase n=2 Tax=Protaetiibacter larvae TaxID=2592654 RepID=A0A5C1YCI9_9MICO|nr:glycosylase [Protaetiibacter larvae]
MSLEVRDAEVELRADPARVVVDLFLPGESTPGATSRTEQVVARVLSLPREALDAEVVRLGQSFGRRIARLPERARANAEKVLPLPTSLDAAQLLVLGATFMAEYAVEGAAVCNPSVVVAPDQQGLGAGRLRVLRSLRSIGDASWGLDELQRALEHDGPLTEVAQSVLQKLSPRPDAIEVEAAIAALASEFFQHYDSASRVEAIRRAVRSVYDAVFAADTALSRRVLLPVSADERHGMEDVRFVRFVDDDGTVDYRASYTAYNGHAISSRLITTLDFVRFSIRRLTGAPARTKGMAFFPRRVDGRLLALTRSDGESVSLATSDDGTHWNDEGLVHVPSEPWEIVQSGNCGSPIETGRGWLTLIHGVGPVRRYSIGALLLDLDDPSQVIGRLVAPLLEPPGSGHDGYVPNVVYTCGAVLQEGTLWIPYGVGDDHIRVASVRVDELLDAMVPVPH